MRHALASLAFLLAVACSPTAAPCNSSNCAGCCDSNGQCAVGSSNLACGASGSACANCSLGTNCFLGQCTMPNAGGGSGGGSTGGGGGTATGGGTAMGGGGGTTGGGGGTTGGGGGTTTGGGGGATAGGTGGGSTGGGGGAALFPNVMLVVDTSGSMQLPTNSSNPNCPTGCGVSGMPCPSNCPTRIGELRPAVANWLAVDGTRLRTGLTRYPAGTLCELPTGPSVALPAPTSNDVGTMSTLQANATQISVTLQSTTPVGGTPTGGTLNLMSSIPGLTAADGRADYVVLITDGLPNCNPSNPNSLCACGSSCTSTQLAACQCTASSCSGSTLCSNGCLDSSATLSAVSNLAGLGIKTIVIGFGPDILTPGPATTLLDGMARAGLAPRSCPNGTSAECGAGAQCLSNRTCDRAYYEASNTAELQAVLESLF